MNYLIKRNISVIALKLLRFKSFSQLIDDQKGMHILSCHTSRQLTISTFRISLNNNQNLFNQMTNRKGFSTSVNLLFFGQLLPVLAIIAGRVVQRRWPYLKHFNTKSLIKCVSEYKFKILFAFSLLIGISNSVYNNCCEETPLTRRKRFVIFRKEDYEPISEMLFKVLYNIYKQKLLPPNHRITKRVNRVVKNLLEANKEFDEITDKNWSVYVIRDSEITNAFVLPTGQIFVYTGIISMCDNDNQLGAILAHELSHTLVGHGKEVISLELLIDLFQSFVVFLLWIRLNALKALIGTAITGIGLKSVVLLPKRRLIEMEADFVGLILTAKTCYDVREGSAFWMKMAANEDNKWSFRASTHPSNTYRYECMDSYMDSMIKLMETLNCPQLSRTDPRDEMRRKYSHYDRTVFSH